VDVHNMCGIFNSWCCIGRRYCIKEWKCIFYRNVKAPYIQL